MFSYWWMLYNTIIIIRTYSWKRPIDAIFNVYYLLDYFIQRNLIRWLDLGACSGQAFCSRMLRKLGIGPKTFMLGVKHQQPNLSIWPFGFHVTLHLLRPSLNINTNLCQIIAKSLLKMKIALNWNRDGFNVFNVSQVGLEFFSVDHHMVEVKARGLD